MKAGNSAAARDVGLQNVHGARFEQAPRVIERGIVLAGGDGHAVRRTFANMPQTGRIVGCHGLLEPTNICLAACVGEAKRLLDRKSAVRVDEELAILADGAPGGHGAARIAGGIAADLHLDVSALVLVRPAGELLGQPLIRIGREAAAAVDASRIPAAPEQRRQRLVQDLGLEVPERRVDGGYGAGGESGPAEVSHSAQERQPAAGYVEAVRADKLRLRQFADEGRDRSAGVGVAEPRLVPRLEVDHDQCRRIPRERVPSASGPSVGMR